MWRALDIASEDVTERLRTALNVLMGQGKRYSVEDVAAETDINLRSLYEYKNGQAEMSVTAFFKLATFFVEDRARFADKVLAGSGLRLMTDADGKTYGDALDDVDGLLQALRDNAGGGG